MGGRGSGGHNRKAAQVHLLEGSYRADRHGRFRTAGVPGRHPELAEPPDWLAWLPEAARERWRELAPTLIRWGLLEPLTAGHFALYVTSWATSQRLQAAINRDGPLLTGPRGALRPHPLLRAARQQEAMALRLASEWGLTPLGRRRLGLPLNPDRGPAASPEPSLVDTDRLFQED